MPTLGWPPSWCPICPDGPVAAQSASAWGCWGLTAYFARQVPDHDAFPAKGIRKPLLICLLVFVPLLGIVLYPLLSATPS